MWSGPRNVSTAIMYSFAQRPDTTVWDEPLYGHYLRISGAQHPGRKEILEKMDQDGAAISRQMINQDFAKPILFIKNMAHHLVEVDEDFLKGLSNLILIRDPAEMLPSLINQIPDPTLRDTGLKRQWELFSNLKKLQEPIVIDSREFLLQPKKMLQEICRHLTIPFYPSMLKWKPGPIPEDGVWSSYWYHEIHLSSGFKPYKKKRESLPASLTPLLEECNFYYRKLLEVSVRISV